MNSVISKTLVLGQTARFNARNLHTTSVCCKVRAGRIRPSKYKNRPINYEQAHKPELIMHKKGYLSFNTSNLHGEGNAHEMAFEDLFIRQFFHGTFFRMMCSDIIIKRRFNILEITVMITESNGRPSQLSFLISYSEHLLSKLFNYNVKVHVFLTTKEDAIFKYV